MGTYTKGFKIRIYPNQAQKSRIHRTLGCCRFVYNHFLALCRDEWAGSQKSVTYNQASALMTGMKRQKEYVWLNEADSMALQESLRNLERAYQNFFKKRAKYPRFKSKHVHCQSYRTRNQSNGIRIIGNKIKLPKIGEVKAKLSQNVGGKILNATITRTASGKYYVSLCVEMDMGSLLRRNAGGSIGIDVGLKEFYTDSDGGTVNNPGALRKLSKKLAREQRRLARKKMGSANRGKSRIRVARVHERIANIRRDFLHKASTALVRQNQTIAIECLRIKNMMKNHRLAKAISDASWSEFFRQLEYKAVLYGTEILKVDTFYPSSQTCSVCGHKNAIVKNLAVREWDCPECGAHHGRDENAARNILSKAQEQKTA